MATHIEYINAQSMLKTEITTIGYLKINPRQTLRYLLPKVYVADYLGTRILSRSEFDNHNQGLKISEIEKGIGLTGTIKMLEQNELFRSCKHKKFSKEQGKKIVEEMKSRIEPISRFAEPLHEPEAEKYSLIFDILGFPISIEELEKISTHEDYYKPIKNCRIIMDTDDFY